MDRKQTRENVLEHVVGTLISWRSILGGFLVALVAQATLSALGAAFMGTSTQAMIQEAGEISRLSPGAGLWMIVTTIFALGLGTYVASRTSPFITATVGGAQGLIIGALFFAFMIHAPQWSIGGWGRDLSSAMSTLGRGPGDLAFSPQVQGVIHRTLGETSVKSDPILVAQNLGVFLARGEESAARNYLAFQSGLTGGEIETLFQIMKMDFQTQMMDAGMRAAQARSAASWTLLGALLLGSAASMLGGAVGTRQNRRKPLADEHTPARALAAQPA